MHVPQDAVQSNSLNLHNRSYCGWYDFPFILLTYCQKSIVLELISTVAQSTFTVSIFEEIVEEISPPGKIEGVGPDGTTYVLSALATLDEETDTTIVVPVTSESISCWFTDSLMTDILNII